MSRVVNWVGLAWVGMLITFMLSVPIFQAPDEPQHLDRVRDTAVTGFPAWDDEYISAEVLESMRILQFSIVPMAFAAEAAPPRPQPNFNDLAAESPSRPVNQLAGHPPAYYALIGGARTFVVSWLPSSLWQFDREILLVRFLNVLLLAPLPWIAARAARNIGMPLQSVWLAAVVPVSVPQLAHIGSVVNNDNLLILSAGLATMFAADVLGRGMRAVPVMGLATSAAVAAQTKLFGVLVAVFATWVILLALRRESARWRLGLGGLVIVALASWTYVRNLVLFGHIYPTRAPDGSPPTGVDFPFDAVRFLRELWLNTTESFWGRFGWLQLQILYPWVALLSIAVIACVSLAALRPVVPAVRPLLVPIALFVPTYTATALIGHLDTGLFPAEQGRYLFPLIVSLSVAVASTLYAVPGRTALLALLLVAGFNWILSMRRIFQAYWPGRDLSRLESLAAWSPVGTWSVIALIAASLVLAGGLMAAAVIPFRQSASVSSAAE